MKKIILSVLGGAMLTFVIIFGSTLLQSSKGKPRLKEKVPAEQLKMLDEMGFKNCENLNIEDGYDFAVNPDRIKFYHEKYGLRYFSETGLSKMMKEFDIVKGMPVDYTGRIPTENIKEMREKVLLLTSPAITSVYYYGQPNDEKSIMGYVPASEIRPEAKTALDVNSKSFSGYWLWLGTSVFKDIYSGQNDMLALYKATKPGDIAPKPPVIMIVAPKEDFNMSGNVVENNTVMKKKADPMVIALVDDGYLVLTQW